MKKTKKIIVIASILILFALYLFFFVNAFIPKILALSTDEMRYYYFIDSVITNGNAQINIGLNHDYNTTLFSYPRGISVFGKDDKLYINSLSGPIYFYSIQAFFLTNEQFKSFFLYQNFLLLIIVIILAWIINIKLFQLLTQKNQVGFSFLLTWTFVITPSIIFVSTFPLDFLISLLFFEMCIYSLLNDNLFLSYVFLGVSMWLRITYLFFIPMLIFYSLIVKKKQYNFILKEISIFFLLFIFLNILSTFVLFNSPISPAYLNIAYQPGTNSVSKPFLQLYLTKFEDIAKNFPTNFIMLVRYYHIFYYPLILISFSTLVLLFLKNLNPKIKWLIIIFIFVILINMAYYSIIAQNLFGYGKVIAESNVFRYLIPITFLFNLLVLIMFSKLNISKHNIIVFGFLILILFVNASKSYISTNGNLKYQTEYEQNLHSFKTQNLNSTMFNVSKTIVITPDIVSVEVFYPEIKNLIYVTNLNNESYLQMKSLIIKLLNDDYKVILPYSLGYSFYSEDKLYFDTFSKDFNLTKMELEFKRKQMQFYVLSYNSN